MDEYVMKFFQMNQQTEEDVNAWINERVGEGYIVDRTGTVCVCDMAQGGQLYVLMVKAK